MTAFSRTVCMLVLGCGFAGSALAAMDSAGSSDQNSAPSAQIQPHLSQKLHDDLTKAGFTDITIMPASLLVRAKDSQGNSVMMLINSDSLTEVTEQTKGHQEAPLAGAIKGEANSPIPAPAPKQ